MEAVPKSRQIAAAELYEIRSSSNKAIDSTLGILLRHVASTAIDVNNRMIEKTRPTAGIGCVEVVIVVKTASGFREELDKTVDYGKREFQVHQSRSLSSS